jgi:transposase
MHVELRRQMALYAIRHGVSAAARRFGTTRTTVRKWRDRYQAQGVRGLGDRSRAPKHIPHKTSKKVAARLIRLRKRYPGWGVDRLLLHFNISCSRPAWHAYTHANNTWHATLFADYVLGHLAACDGDITGTAVQTDNGSEFIGSSRKVHGGPTLFEETVRHYTGQLPVTIFPGAKTCQSDVEAYHRLVEDEFLAVERYETKAQFLGRSRIYQAYFNHHRRLIWKGGKTPAQFFADAQGEGHQPAATPAAFTLPPIVLDDVEPLLPAPGYHLPVMVTNGFVGC